MKAQEFAIINKSLLTKEQNGQVGQRNFPLDQLKTAQDIWEKIKKNIKEEDGREIFVDGEVDFSTEEKKFILDLLKRSWSLPEAEHVQSVKEQLS